jgi:hypothetical protein
MKFLEMELETKLCKTRVTHRTITMVWTCEKDRIQNTQNTMARNWRKGKIMGEKKSE